MVFHMDFRIPPPVGTLWFHPSDILWIFHTAGTEYHRLESILLKRFHSIACQRLFYGFLYGLFYGCSLGHLQLCSSGCPIVLLWFSIDFLWDFFGNVSLDFLWFVYGISVAIIWNRPLWNFYGLLFSVEFLWISYGTANMEILWSTSTEFHRRLYGILGVLCGCVSYGNISIEFP